MDTLEIQFYDEATLRTLYEVYKFRTKEIGQFYGKDETTIQKELLRLGVPTMALGSERVPVQIVNKFVPKKKAKDFEQEIVGLIGMGWDDKKIADHLGLEYHRVSYFRKNKLGMDSSYTHISDKGAALRDTSLEALKADYYSMTKEDLAKKYGMAPESIRKHLRENNVDSKRKNLRGIVQPLTKDQTTLVLGSMLGDAGISEGRYREFHCHRQLGYLRLKHDMLAPHVRGISPEDTGSCFTSWKHPAFAALEAEIYVAGTKGKHIPFGLYTKNWDIRMLVYWFLDDGTYDHDSNSLSICNKCPDENQLKDLLVFVESQLKWGFKYSKNTTSGMFFVTIEKAYYPQFFAEVVQVAPPCMLYKVPREFVPTGSVTAAVLEEIPLDHVTSGMYEAMSLKDRKRAERRALVYWGRRGFPYVSLTEERAASDFHAAVKSLKGESCVLDGDTVHILKKAPGSRLLEWMFPNIYKCCRKGNSPPVESWKSPKRLHTLVVNRLRHADGSINDSAMRKGIKLHWGAVYNFRSSTAAQIFKAFNVNGRVLDYSAGFGARMLAASALGLEYHGFEPNTETFANLEKFSAWMGSRGDSTPRHLYNRGSELMDLPEGYFGLVFSSPPYFDLELYGNEPTQSIQRFPRRVDWLEGYWAETVHRSIKSLAHNGVFAVCLSPYSCADIIAKTEAVCASLGLSLIREIKVPIGRVLQGGSDGNELIHAYSRASVVMTQPTKTQSSRPGGVGTIRTIHTTTPEIQQAKLHAEGEALQGRKEMCLSFSWKLHKNTREEANELYKEGKIAFSGVDIERFFGTWNKFLLAAGKPLNREYSTKPLDSLREYILYCLERGGYRTAHQYQAEMGNVALPMRVKKLFKPGGLLRDLWGEFLDACNAKIPEDSFLQSAQKLL